MPIPVQRVTTYPSGIHRFLAYDTSNTTLEGLSSSIPKETLKITNDRVYTSNITILGNIEFGTASSILRQRLQVNPLRQIFYVSTNSCNEFVMTTEGIYGAASSNVAVFVNQSLLMNYSDVYQDYTVTYSVIGSPASTEYKITLTNPALFGDFVDITIWPQLILESALQQGYVYQQVNLSYFRQTGSDIYYTGNLGIGTTTPLDKLHVNGNMILQGNSTSNYLTYRSYTSNVLLPVSSGKINGVNITALNSRVRASYASSINCVSRWTIRNAASTNSWNSICWSPELGIFVAVSVTGTSDRVMTSPDGITWTSRVSATSNSWRSVCWSSELGIFVAVSSTGTGDRVMTSSDGITWTSRVSAANKVWRSVCWSPELRLFVAVSSATTGDRIMTSPNGITWTAYTIDINNGWFICWSSELGIFVALSQDSTSSVAVSTSIDGVNWILRNTPSDATWYSVCWSPELSLFVAVGGSISSTGNVMISSDGITWSGNVLNTPILTYVCWSPELSLFVATCSNSTTPFVTSPDGIVWTSRIFVNDSNTWTSICWSPELSIFVAVSNTNTSITNKLVCTSDIGMPNSKSVVKALSTQVSVDSNGNVGIGTNNPQYTLDIYGNVFLGRSGSSLSILGCLYPIILGGALSDESTALATTNTLKLYAPYNLNVRTLKLPKFTINTAATSTITFDITKNGTTIYSSKPTITTSNKYSSNGTLTTNPTTFSENDEIVASVNVAGTGGTGAKVYIYCS